MMYFDPGLLFIGVVFMGIGYYVQNKLKSKFHKYSQVSLRKNLSGREIAEIMLRDHDIYDVKVVSVPGKLTDHYNPLNKTINLSPEVYEGRSVSAAAVAAHECGHAVQHATQYAFLKMRSALVPIQTFAGKTMNTMIWVLFPLTMVAPNIMPMNMALLIIIFCYGAFTLFSFITLPVEFDASNRAIAWVTNRQIVTREESFMAKDALKWAAMTYVVVALQSLATLLYYLMLFLRRR